MIRVRHLEVADALRADGTISGRYLSWRVPCQSKRPPTFLIRGRIRRGKVVQLSSGTTKIGQAKSYTINSKRLFSPSLTYMSPSIVRSKANRNTHLVSEYLLEKSAKNKERKGFGLEHSASKPSVKSLSVSLKTSKLDRPRHIDRRGVHLQCPKGSRLVDYVCGVLIRLTASSEIGYS